MEVKVVLRDKHLTITDNYFGTKDIPTVICLSNTTLEKNGLPHCFLVTIKMFC